MAKFLESARFRESRLEIERHLSSLQDPRAYSNFVDEYDETLKFIGENPTTPPTEALTGQQTWNFINSRRYRLYFYSQISPSTGEVTIFLAEIIPNQSEKSMIYPRTDIPTYREDD